MILTVATLVVAGLLLEPAQAPNSPTPLSQLIHDLDTGAARAHLTDAQKSRIQADRAVLEITRKTKEQGGAIDRRQVAGAVKSIRQTIEDGGFTPQDQQTLRSDIELLRRQ